MKLTQENLELVKWAFLQGYRQGYNDSENGVYIDEEQLAIHFLEMSEMADAESVDSSSTSRSHSSLASTAQQKVLDLELS
ncbi:hypothetical protein KIH87_02355 [Paraneptunicella aestuarii]|uniref:hypothetical protein n=1 Tax=Paraneptunicella aestuarii TaxID=2831148 RepID=UPI001E5BE105|nr:hypothetical protein [Paraneptunicella aestuarii]UAA39226.1 hypothetical protein KIH87_02355 [Paraneptunicella aestuarii]